MSVDARGKSPAGRFSVAPFAMYSLELGRKAAIVVRDRLQSSGRVDASCRCADAPCPHDAGTGGKHIILPVRSIEDEAIAMGDLRRSTASIIELLNAF